MGLESMLFYSAHSLVHGPALSASLAPPLVPLGGMCQDRIHLVFSQVHFPANLKMAAFSCWFKNFVP